MKRLLPLVPLFLFTGCGSGTETPAAGPPVAAAPTSTTLPVFLRVTTGHSRSLLTVVEHDGKTTIVSRLGGTTVTIAGQNGRYVRRGRLLIEAKRYSDGIKLKTAAGRTLWRAKIAAGRVQIRRGEVTTRYEFRRESAGRIKVEQGAVELGDVRAVEQGTRIESAGGATIGVSTSRPGTALAVLFCREMAPDLRAVLTAAMLAPR